MAPPLHSIMQGVWAPDGIGGCFQARFGCQGHPWFLASPMSAELPGGGDSLELGKEPWKGEGQGGWPVRVAADFRHGVLLFHNASHDAHMTTEQGSLGLGSCRSSLP